LNYKPNCKEKEGAIFFHLGVKEPYFTAGCVAIDENNMKSIVNWLDQAKTNHYYGNLEVLKNGL
jgi:L,D-peptidoglycan transpeptidase YkuD (ErfK/YbiS/YcfS/YnhG family)